MNRPMHSEDKPAPPVLTLKQADQLLNGSTIFKLKFIEGILMELSCPEDRVELSSEGFYGWHLILAEIRAEVDQAAAAIFKADLASRRPTA